jgi:hypothetical protein
MPDLSNDPEISDGFPENVWENFPDKKGCRNGNFSRSVLPCCFVPKLESRLPLSGKQVLSSFALNFCEKWATPFSIFSSFFAMFPKTLGQQLDKTFFLSQRTI